MEVVYSPSSIFGEFWGHSPSLPKFKLSKIPRPQTLGIFKEFLKFPKFPQIYLKIQMLFGYILGSGAMYLCIKIFIFNYSRVSNKRTGPNIQLRTSDYIRSPIYGVK